MRSFLSLSKANGQSVRRKRVPVWRALLAGLITSGLLMAGPLNAMAVEPLPALEVTGFGPGLEIQGLHPGQGSGMDPTAEYPAENPADYVDIDTFAGIVNAVSAEGQPVQMYCINVYLETGVGIEYQLDSWAESNVPNIGYVTFILNNYYPMMPQPAGLTADQQAAAVQSAIWYFTDGYVVDTAQTDIRGAVAAIVAAAQANGPVLEPAVPGIEITPETASADMGTRAGPFTVNGENVDAVTVTVPDGFTLHTAQTGGDALASGFQVLPGTQLWVQNNTTGPSSGALGAVANVNVQAGSVYLAQGNPGAAQPLILAATSQLGANDTALFSHLQVDPGSLTVAKTITGAGAGNQGDIVVNVDCGAGFPGSFTIPAGTPAGVYTQAFEGIADGALCTVSEEVTGANEVVTVTAGETITVQITSGNTAVAELVNDVQFIYGQLLVTKSLAGAAAGLQDRVVLSVICDGTVRDTILIPAGSTAAVSRSYPDIPAGSTCFIREEESGQNSAVLVTVDLPDPVTVMGGESVSLEAVNTFTGRGQAKLPQTGAALTTEMALMGGGILLTGTLLVLGSALRRRNQ